MMLEDKKDGWKALIALAPALLILIIFTFLPIINTTITAFLDNWCYSGLVNATEKVCTEYNSAGTCILWESPKATVSIISRLTKIFAFRHSFNGFGVQSFVAVLSDTYFWNALKNTFLMVFISVPVTVVLGLLVAVALNSIKKLQGFFQTVFFLPYVTNTIALGMVFQIMFTNDNGLINNIIESLGGVGVNWIGVGSSYWAGMFVITMYTVWNGLAFKILVLLSGLQGIDKQYYQAAQIDGASKSKTFFKITVPLLSPMIAYIVITSFIGAFKAYTSIISVYSYVGNDAMGPSGNPQMLETVVGYIYRHLNLTTPGEVPISAAASLILLLIILLFTLIQLWVSKKKVHY